MVASEQEEDCNDHLKAVGSGLRCACFQVFGLRWWQGHEDEGKGLLEQKGESWVSSNLKKMKEVSEVIAGPQWKTFIRKVSWYGKKQQKSRFQYDEHSYALNFNSGAQGEDEDMPPTFSARFTAPFPAGRRKLNYMIRECLCLKRYFIAQICSLLSIFIGRIIVHCVKDRSFCSKFSVVSAGSFSSIFLNRSTS